jgi:hypothetical protein
MYTYEVISNAIAFHFLDNFFSALEINIKENFTYSHK